jgi:hypothetical protein
MSPAARFLVGEDDGRDAGSEEEGGGTSPTGGVQQGAGGAARAAAARKDLVGRRGATRKTGGQP